MRRFEKKEKIRRANILLEERMRNLKEYGSEFGPGGEFDDSELQGQEDFYDNMNQNSKEPEVSQQVKDYALKSPSTKSWTSQLNYNLLKSKKIDKGQYEVNQKWLDRFFAKSLGQEHRYEESKGYVEDGINPITGYDVDKESPGLPNKYPYSTPHNPTTYSSSQIEKSRNNIRKDRDLGEGVSKLKQLKESFDKIFKLIIK